MPCYVLGSRSAQRLARPRALSERCEPLARGTQSTSRTSSGAGAHSRRMSWPAGARGPIYFQGPGCSGRAFRSCAVARGLAGHNLLHGVGHGWRLRSKLVVLLTRTRCTSYIKGLVWRRRACSVCVVARGFTGPRSEQVLWPTGAWGPI